MSLFSIVRNSIRQSKDPLEIGYKKLDATAKENMFISRTEIINFLVEKIRNNNESVRYLEIGVRNPLDNFDHIKAEEKYSVDPGLEFDINPVDFKITSDEFFSLMSNSDFKLYGKKFDLIFIDGLHKAPQVKKDIANSLKHLSKNGCIVLHDCNPPTEWHAREDFNYKWTPASGSWNGTTWKAFIEARYIENVESCCIDTDWGVGVINYNRPLGRPGVCLDTFYEFDYFDSNRESLLGLVSFEEFKNKFSI